MNKHIILLAVGIATSALASNLKIEPGKPLPNYTRVDLPGNDRFIGSGHTLADLNKDGRPDILVVTHSHGVALTHLGVRVYLQESNGNFRLGDEYIISDRDGLFGESLNMRIMVGDVNEDGHSDFVVEDFGDNRLLLYTGFGNGAFNPPVALDITVFGRFALLHDVNSDNHLDLIGEGSLGGLSIFEGDGKGGFREARALQTTGKPGQIQAGDVNNDGKLDVVAASFDGVGPNRVVDVFLGKGDGTFEPAITTRMGDSAGRGNALADLNGDGKLDYVADDRDATAIDVWLGQGDGTFLRGRPVLQSEVAHIRIADLNDDSIPDLIAATTFRSGGGPLSMYLGNGDGTFQTRREYSVGADRDAFWPEFADLNGDGRMDIVVQNSGTESELISVSINSGSPVTAVRPALVTIQESSGATNILESSLDLKSWEPLSTNSTAGAWRYNHSEPAPRRFYRARSF